MVESPPGEEPRVAEAVARLLSRQATLLARSADDEAAAGVAKLGLSWLGDLLRSLGLLGASDWFQALRVRADVLGDRPSAAWVALAAPLCEVLAADLRRTGTLAPLADGAHDWRARVAELTAFAEPAPAPVPPPPAAPAPMPATDDTRTLLFEAIADFTGDASPGVDARHGRVEISGTRPTGGEARDRAELDALDRAARAAGAVLLTIAEGDRLRWILRLPLSQAGHYLFAEWGGLALAISWSLVVDYGLEPGGERSRVVLGNGLERRELAVDWLFGKGEGAALAHVAPPDSAAAPSGFHFTGLVEDAEGRAARVLAVAPAPVAVTAELPLIVQPEPPPADNHPGGSAPARSGMRALVADDSMMARVFLGRLLEQRGFVVDEAEDGAQAGAALANARYDVVFLDAEMPGAGAIEILHDAGALLAGRACVLIKDDEERRRVESFGPVPVLYKPFAEDEVRGAVEALLARLPKDA